MSAKPKLHAKKETATVETNVKTKSEPKTKPEPKQEEHSKMEQGPKPENKPNDKPEEEKKKGGRGKQKAENKTDEEKAKEAEKRKKEAEEKTNKINMAIEELCNREVLNKRVSEAIGHASHIEYAKIFTKLVRSVLIHMYEKNRKLHADYTSFPPNIYNLDVNNFTNRPKTDEQNAPAPKTSITDAIILEDLDYGDEGHATDTQKNKEQKAPDMSNATNGQKPTSEQTTGNKNLPSTTSNSCKAALGFIVSNYLQGVLIDVTFNNTSAIKHIKDENDFIKAVFYNVSPKQTPRVMLIQSIAAAVQKQEEIIKDINFIGDNFDSIKTLAKKSNKKSPEEFVIYSIKYLEIYFKLLAIQIANQLWTHSVSTVTREHIVTAMLNLDGMDKSYKFLVDTEILEEKSKNIRYFPLMKNICADVNDYYNAYYPPTHKNENQKNSKKNETTNGTERKTNKTKKTKDVKVEDNNNETEDKNVKAEDNDNEVEAEDNEVEAEDNDNEAEAEAEDNEAEETSEPPKKTAVQPSEKVATVRKNNKKA